MNNDARLSIFKNTPKTIYKISMKINLVKFFAFKVYFSPLRQPGLFQNKNRFPFKSLLNEGS